jgi:NitT/TauT family transport system substrate-binding protein
MRGTNPCTRRLALALPTLLAACGGSRGARHVRLVIAGTPAMLTYLPHTLAYQLGFYRQQGLTVHVESVAGGSRGLRSLIGGSADVVAGYFDHPLRISALGRPARSFVTMSRYPGNVILASSRAARPIERLEDLRGATVGIPDHGSQAHLFLNCLLLLRNVPLTEVKTVPIGLMSSGMAALEQGKIDAWCGFDPGVTRYLQRHPETRILVDGRTAEGMQACLGITEYAGAVLYSTAAWLDRHADAARGIALAVVRALRWMQQHTSQEIAAQVPASLRGDDAALYLRALDGVRPMFSPDGRMSVQAARAVKSVVATSLVTVRAADLDLEQTFTNRFVDEATRG